METLSTVEILGGLIGGLALFLFGMQVMSDALRRRTGEKLRDVLERMTAGRLRALLFGAGVTAAVQSSSAVTVMTVGFVDAGLLGLRQAIGVVMGANVGTTVTAWLVSSTSVEGSAPIWTLLKPSFFTPILGLVGASLLLFSKKTSRRDTAHALLGFCVLMTGMEQMSAAVKPLAASESAERVLTLFSHPLLGVAVGVLLTAVLQSSSASLGLLQALSSAGVLSLGAVVPIVMGLNIGTCVTTLLSAIGTGRAAKRVAVSHLYFNVIGTALLLSAFALTRGWLWTGVWSAAASPVSIAAVHTAFNVVTTVLLFPFVPSLERLAVRTVRDEPRGRGRRRGGFRKNSGEGY